jgi:exopolysaccharide biosynthesis polyprenyl glycosylphosphotransferase
MTAGGQVQVQVVRESADVKSYFRLRAERRSIAFVDHVSVDAPILAEAVTTPAPTPWGMPDDILETQKLGVDGLGAGIVYAGGPAAAGPALSQTHAATADIEGDMNPSGQSETALPIFRGWPGVPRGGRGAYLAPRQRWKRVRLAIDTVALAVTIGLVVTVGGQLDVVGRCLVIAFGLGTLAALHLRRAPDDRLNASALATFGNVLGICSLAALLTISLGAILNDAHPVALGFRLWLFSVPLLGVTRVSLLAARKHVVRRNGLETPTLIVGAGIVGTHLAHRLTSESYGMRPVGYLDANPLPRSEGSRALTLPVFGSPDGLEEAIATTGARHVILSFSSGPDHLLVAIVRRCHQLGLGVSLVPRLFESINERSTLDHVGGVPLLTLHPIDPKGWQFSMKHAIDRSAALFALLILSPVMILIALLVRHSSPGPALFRQLRVGRDGREFAVLKFRTMRTEATTPEEFELPDGLAPGGVEGQDRRTCLGRWLRDLSLDELPQLLNVLRGDMSLVGPRPERPEYALRFSLDVARYEDRHRVKSGITGWAQVHGLRGQTSIADRVEWDNYYIQNWSLRLDFRIMLLTIVEMLRQRDGPISPPGSPSDF